MKNFDHPMKRIKKCESKRLQKNLMNIIRPRSLILALVSLLLVTFSAAAGTSVEGVVKDPIGRPIKAADVRFEAKNFSKTVRTDISGHYICDGLGVGTYKITLVVSGKVKASILDAKTQAGKATQLNFNLTGKMVSTKKNTHMTYMGGRWVEVDDNGNIVNTTGASNVETVRGTGLHPPIEIRMRSNQPEWGFGSSQRFKTEIKSMDKASEAILALKPVTFRYKKELDPEGIRQFGLVAEDVEKVNPDLVLRDDSGKVYTVRYEAVNAMLLNEFLKEHREVQEQKATIAKQQKQIEALTVGLQKVSAQIEASKPAPQVVNNNQ
jgi:Chaperone of endosialidase/Carboxypeptidase regulatory-like domain